MHQEKKKNLFPLTRPNLDTSGYNTKKSNSSQTALTSLGVNSNFTENFNNSNSKLFDHQNQENTVRSSIEINVRKDKSKTKIWDRGPKKNLNIIMSSKNRNQKQSSSNLKSNSNPSCVNDPEKQFNEILEKLNEHNMSQLKEKDTSNNNANNANSNIPTAAKKKKKNKKKKKKGTGNAENGGDQLDSNLDHLSSSIVESSLLEGNNDSGNLRFWVGSVFGQIWKFFWEKYISLTISTRFDGIKTLPSNVSK